MQTKISIIIPVYNAAKYLKQCITSVLNQTFKNYELICIDDGSTDSSLKILQEYQQKDSRIKIFEQQHKGVAAVRNFGVSLAQGDFIQFLDADDYFEPNFLTEMIERAEKHGADIVICSYRKVDDNENITESKNPNSPINLDKIPMECPFSKADFKDNIFNLLTPTVWNKLIKKSLISTNNIQFPDISVASDIAFSHACLICAEKIIAFDQELINYRFNCSGSIATRRAKHTIDVVHSCLALKEFLTKKGLFKEFELAFEKAFRNHLRWDIGLCNNEEYENFLNDFKQIIPDWQRYNSALKKESINIDYLNNIIENKKAMLWGASFYIQNILKMEKSPNPNILGFIDKNIALQGNYIGNYKVYPPESLNNLKPDFVIMTIWSNNEVIYPILQKEFSEKYPGIELYPNIFE